MKHILELPSDDVPDSNVAMKTLEELLEIMRKMSNFQIVATKIELNEINGTLTITTEPMPKPQGFAKISEDKGKDFIVEL